MLRYLIAAALLIAPGAALADKADADACAAKLDGQTKVVYRGVVAQVQRGATLENAVRAVVEPRVQSGRLSEAEARKIGRAAANCARLVHRKA